MADSRKLPQLISILFFLEYLNANSFVVLSKFLKNSSNDIKKQLSEQKS